MPHPAEMPVLRRARLGAEFLALYGGGPLLILMERRAGLLFGMIWFGALLAFVWMRGDRAAPHVFSAEIREIFVRFVVLAPLIALLTWFLWPDTFLSLPRQKPLFWLMIMCLYPLLSVWPQEVLYRAFLFRRYSAVFGSTGRTVVASAVAFGFAHVIFLNWIAVVMTALGGLIFARDYGRHRSLKLVCLEHSLYGCLIFTVGLGRFFYTGAAWHHG